MTYEPGRCGGCGSDMAVAAVAGIERQQVIDLPPVLALVTGDQMELLPDYRPRKARQAGDGCRRGTAGLPRHRVHDAWVPCDNYQQVARHALCSAHALRELQAFDTSPPGQWCWAGQAADALRTMKAHG